MASFTRPLNLRANITVSDRSFDWIAGLNVLLATLMLLFLGSRYVYAPGLLVSVADSPELPAELALPLNKEALSGVDSAAVASVLTVQQDNVFLFEGSIHSFNTLERTLKRDTARANAVLLLKIGRNVSMQTFVDVCALAKSAGFASVQVAVEQPIGALEYSAEGARVTPLSLPLPN